MTNVDDLTNTFKVNIIVSHYSTHEIVFVQEISFDGSNITDLSYLLGNAFIRQVIIDQDKIMDKDDILPTKECLQDSIQWILKKFVRSHNVDEERDLPRGLQTSCDLVASALCLKITQSGELHRGRRSTKLLNKFFPSIEKDNSLIVEKSLLVNQTVRDSLSNIEQNSDASVQQHCMTYDYYVREFFAEYIPEYKNSVFSNQNISIIDRTLSDGSTNELVDFGSSMASFFTQEWNAYKNMKRGDNIAMKRSFTLLCALLKCILAIFWARVQERIEKAVFWNHWYPFVVVAGALCVVFDAQYRRASSSLNKVRKQLVKSG